MRFPLLCANVVCASVAAALLATGPVSADDAKRPEHKITQSDSYILIEPMYATIIDSDRPSGMLMVAIGLDVPDAGLRAEAQHALPVLRDDYVRSLMSYAATAVRMWQQPDVNLISERMQRVTDRALKRKGARVLLAQVAIRITK
jgi:flagellar basal body-associated protein FliL